MSDPSGTSALDPARAVVAPVLRSRTTTTGTATQLMARRAEWGSEIQRTAAMPALQATESQNSAETTHHQRSR